MSDFTVLADRSSLTLRDDLRVTGVGSLDACLARILDWTSGLRALNERYQAVPATACATRFVDLVLEALDVAPRLHPGELENVPASGPAIIASNHPFGGIDGLLMAKIILERRSDLRILANRYLERVRELTELLIGVDVFAARDAARHNVPPLRAAIRWVRGGGALLMFPSGEVSHLHLTSGRVTDPAWRPSVGCIAQRTAAPVTPAFVCGRNSWGFQLLGCLHPHVRTTLLPHEILNKAHRRIPIRFGATIPPSRVRAFSSATELTRYLRLRAYALSRADTASIKTPTRAPRAAVLGSRPAAAAGRERRLLASEIEALPAAQCLARCGTLQAIYARADQIHWIMREIARLREITFRAVGEGTGSAVDTDRYDASYLHLFLWNSEREQIVGAYRVAEVAEVVRKLGPSGLYTHSLFDYGRGFIDRVGDGIELGRSFVRPEYQKARTPLMLLWRGIARLVTLNPRLRRMFGAVSISNDYDPVSRRFIIDFLRENRLNRELARHVRPRTEYLDRTHTFCCREDLRNIGDLDSLSEIVTALEGGRRGLPVLLRHYLKLGGELLGFNLDRSFANAVDGLLLVDLPRANRRILAYYMGDEECRRYLRHHATSGPTPEALEGACEIARLGEPDR